ncbi:hypothetical protein [Nocardia sp. NPDC059239]|uniref:hypothetical protein n=1 Tax=unclassified Nocardia TaxID=2637762 RepID=UPI003680928F
MAPRKNTTKTVEKVRDDFVYTVDDREIRLPSLANLKPGIVRKVRRLGEVDAMFTMMEMTLDEDALALVDDMESEVFEDMCDKWRKHSGIDLGESSASRR